MRPDLTLLGGPLLELPYLSPAVVWPAAGFGMTAGRGTVPPNALLRRSLSISGSQHDLELIQLIPLGIGPLSLWNRQKLLQANTGGRRLRIIHGRIISSLG